MSQAAFVYCATCGAANPPDAAACFACGHPPLLADAPAPANSLPTSGIASPRLLKQRYRLLSQVGSGGFGAVYRAEDTDLGNRLVAVKELSQRGLTPEEVPEAANSFRQEALLLAGLTHPHLPRIYEQFAEGGHWYLVMDFIEGDTLEARLARAPGGRLPVPEVVQLGVQLCTVLAYLHARQPPIIFRDLKPANIMLTPAGDLYLIDFGIARHFKPGQTRDTVAFGSAGYAAPEQYGKAQTTTQADIYSLGATLHQCLSGADPAESPFLFAPLHLDEPAGLEALIRQMLETQPSKRPASMAVMKQDLQRMADDLASGRQPPKPKPVVTLASPSGGNVLKPLVLYRGHFDKVNAVAWSPDGDHIASGGDDQTVHIWESASGKKRHALPQAGPVYALSWSPDGEQLAWVNGTGTARLWNSYMKDFDDTAFYRLGFLKGLLSLAWSPDGARLAAGGMGRTVEVWEAKTGKHLLSYKSQKRFFEDTAIHSVAWSSDGQWLASGSVDGIVQVWDATTGSLRCAYRESQLRYRGGIAWSPDASYIASAGSENTVHIWDAATANVYLVLRGHASPIKTVAWSPDGKYVASGSSDQTVRVWDVAAAREALVYIHREGEVNAVAWSPDSMLMASAGDDHQVHIWRVA
ncbi:MAG TPA: WD40 repeat domain-containing serine/threonine-protein kinase [Ktedonobacterales bacterium]|nr:WD40 repeat domain-containing serine/threonine-protein kinase [Ktedonobacterales bacterium]